MNDITLGSDDETAAISIEAAGALLAELSNSAREALLEAISATPRSDENVETQTVAAQLNRFAAMLSERDSDHPPVEYQPKPPARHLRFRQEQIEGAPHMDSELVLGAGAMLFSFEAEELDGHHWGITTMDELEGVAIAEAVLPMITGRKPLTWIKDEVDKLKGGQ